MEEDIEIDAFDPVERCRRGRVALGLEDDAELDEGLSGAMTSMGTEPGQDGCLPLARDVGPEARSEPYRY